MATDDRVLCDGTALQLPTAELTSMGAPLGLIRKRNDVTPSPTGSFCRFEVTISVLNQTSPASTCGAVQTMRAKREPQSSTQSTLRDPGRVQASRLGSMSRQQPSPSPPTRHTSAAGGWGSDTHLYRTLEELQRELPVRLATGEARVLKQCRGHSGLGVWKVEWINPAASHDGDPGGRALPELDALVRVRHAQRGSLETEMSLAAFFNQCEPYFVSSGKLIDQAYQSRLPEGMIRCYLVQNQVAGFGHQAINALYPAPPGAPSSEAPQPGPRLYHTPTHPDFQALKRKLEREWLPALQQELDIDTTHLPILWDADFLLGPKAATGEDTYVLCEINVSSVAPFPESTVPLMAQAALAQVQSRHHTR
jgi:hypothetical protein